MGAGQGSDLVFDSPSATCMAMSPGARACCLAAASSPGREASQSARSRPAFLSTGTKQGACPRGERSGVRGRTGVRGGNTYNSGDILNLAPPQPGARRTTAVLRLLLCDSTAHRWRSSWAIRRRCSRHTTARLCRCHAAPRRARLSSVPGGAGDPAFLGACAAPYGREISVVGWRLI